MANALQYFNHDQEKTNFNQYVPVSNFQFVTAATGLVQVFMLHVTLLGSLGSATCQHVQQLQQTKKDPTTTTSWPIGVARIFIWGVAKPQNHMQ